MAKINIKSKKIVGCRGVEQVGGLVPGYPWEVPLRSMLISLFYSLKAPLKLQVKFFKLIKSSNEFFKQINRILRPFYVNFKGKYCPVPRPRGIPVDTRLVFPLGYKNLILVSCI